MVTEFHPPSSYKRYVLFKRPPVIKKIINDSNAPGRGNLTQGRTKVDRWRSPEPAEKSAAETGGREVEGEGARLESSGSRRRAQGFRGWSKRAGGRGGDEKSPRAEALRHTWLQKSGRPSQAPRAAAGGRRPRWIFVTAPQMRRGALTGTHDPFMIFGARPTAVGCSCGKKYIFHTRRPVFVIYFTQFRKPVLRRFPQIF